MEKINICNGKLGLAWTAESYYSNPYTNRGTSVFRLPLTDVSLTILKVSY